MIFANETSLFIILDFIKSIWLVTSEIKSNDHKEDSDAERRGRESDEKNNPSANCPSESESYRHGESRNSSRPQ